MSELNRKKHVWHFIQTSGLVQLKFTSIDDVLNLKELDQKLWVSLACPVKGLEFPEETLDVLDTDKNGRVRAPEILNAVEFIKKYIRNPEIIMKKGDTIALKDLSDTPFDCGHSPFDSAKSILQILEKTDAIEISLADINVTDKIFAPDVVNGDGVIPAEALKDDISAAVVQDIISCTGGSDDASGAKGITRAQFETFYSDLREMQKWRDDSKKSAQNIFFMGISTNEAAKSYMLVREKICEYYERCSLDSYNSDMAETLRRREEEMFASDMELSNGQLSLLPLACCESDKALPFGNAINPAWKDAIESFRSKVVEPFFGEGKTRLPEADWLKIQDKFEPYMEWYATRPVNTASLLDFERIDEILASDAEQLIAAKLDEEEKQPPLAQATVDLRRLLLLRRDFVELLKNFVSFETFYLRKNPAVFQCGTLYIDGRSCELCFKVLDPAKLATMAPLSQCYLLLCDCTRPGAGEKMQIAAVMSAGSRDNLFVGRNGLFYDRDGNDWDATVTKIIENPISIKEAFWMPYKKLARMIQERVSKAASNAENNVNEKMSAAVTNPTDSSAKAGIAAKKFDVGVIAAMSVAFTGIATVVGGLLSAFFGLGWWVPLGVVGLILLISLPSMIIAWLKLRLRNIAPILDSAGWAVNCNARINITLGKLLTKVGARPRFSRINLTDPYKDKKFPIKRLLLLILVLAVVAMYIVLRIKNPERLDLIITETKSFFFTNFLKKFNK